MLQQPINVRLLITLLPALLITVLMCTSPAHGSAHPEPALRSTHHAPSKLELQVKEWVSSMSEQKPFTTWLSADSQIEALGPGTHSWLVLFTKQGKNIGYMVVHAITDGSFQLGEYGVGPYPLFSQQLLKESILNNGLTETQHLEQLTLSKHYIHPFAALWEVRIGLETYWFDAKSSELIPLGPIHWQQKLAHAVDFSHYPLQDHSQILALKLNKPFDAYERLPWLTEEAPYPAYPIQRLQQHLNANKHIRYVIEPFGDAFLYALPVIGYQHWSNGRLDIALEMNGTRFLPLSVMNEGSFYQ